MEYSKRLGNITNEQFQKALDRFSLGVLIKAEPIPFGLFGQNVFLSTNKGNYVFRGKPHFSWQFPSEKFFADVMHDKASVPVAFPYILDEKTDIFGWSYIIMPRLYGINLADENIRKKLEITVRKEICIDVAKTLAKIQSIQWVFSGNFSEKNSTIVAFDKPFHKWIYDRIRESLQSASKYSLQTTDSDKAWVETILLKAEDAMKISFTPTIVMEDYREGNLTAEKINDKWQVTGIFDLMELYMGDGEISLYRSIAGYYEEAPQLISVFLNTYFSLIEKREGFATRFPVYMLLDRCKIWEWAQQSGSWKGPKVTFREWSEKYILLNKE